jgi:hypothetical protein
MLRLMVWMIAGKNETNSRISWEIKEKRTIASLLPDLNFNRVRG